MYECEECGCVFCEPEYYSEQYEYWGHIVYEELPGCPYCGGSYQRVKDETLEDDEYDEEDSAGLGYAHLSAG